MKFLESYVEVAVREQQRITCEVNRSLLNLVNDIDVEIVQQSMDNTTERIVSRNARKVAAVPTEYYSVMISENSGIGVKIKFEFLNGRYICASHVLCWLLTIKGQHRLVGRPMNAPFPTVSVRNRS